MSGLVAGVDVGGTFTDLVIFDPATGAVRLAKVPTTLPNQAGGVLDAFAEARADLSAIDLIVHGTTTTTNAVLERQLAKTGLITTEGFRDVLELGRRTRPQAYGMHGSFTPVIPRDLRLEVPERMDARGRVVTALDESALRRAVTRLRDAGVDAAGLARLQSPIGLDIGARTPEETAISICAEIIALRTGRAARSLRETSGPIH